MGTRKSEQRGAADAIGPQNSFARKCALLGRPYGSMGLVVSKALEMLSSKQHTRILMLGLDAAGKTTVLYKLQLGDLVTSIPTIGFNVEKVQVCRAAQVFEPSSASPVSTPSSGLL